MRPKPEPKSPSPAASSPGTTGSEKPRSPTENSTAKVYSSRRTNSPAVRRVLTALQSSSQPEEDFESYYIKRVTAEFADDIDKLRNAPDFSEHSVPVLIQALKQASKGFSDEEKEKVMKGR